MRSARIEMHCSTGWNLVIDTVVGEGQRPADDVEPFFAAMLDGGTGGATRLNPDPQRLDAAGSRKSATNSDFQSIGRSSRGARGECRQLWATIVLAEERADSNTQCCCKIDQCADRRLPLTGFQPRQVGLRQARAVRELIERQATALPRRSEPWTDCLEIDRR